MSARNASTIRRVAGETVTVDQGGGSPGRRLLFLAALGLIGCVGGVDGAGDDDTGAADAGGASDATAGCPTEQQCGDPVVCCAVGDLCLSGGCVTPGDPCSEALDCAETDYCDPGLGRCLPRGPEFCEYHPPAGTFAPVQQWAWTGSAVAPASVHVMMAPVVGDLTGDGVPEVAFSTYDAVGSYEGAGVLRVVSGDTGAELLSVTTPVVCPESGIALGDLEGDGVPEIVTSGPCNGPLLAFHVDGTLVWSSHMPDGSAWSSNLRFGAPSIADLEGDGTAEVVAGGAVVEHDGTVRWVDGQAASNCCGESVSAIYDVDADGALEIVGGTVAWEPDGTVLWEQPAAADGYVAVGDFFGDDVPDVVVVHGGNVSIRRGTDGTLLWGPVTQPGGGRGGPPTVADFDGDGQPEIGVAGAGAYAVFDPDGAVPVLWSQVTQDTSSNITGSSVFDFDGDGRAEVVYNDECYMRVYAGADGTVLAEVPQNSHTLIEYPLIVDVDADGNAEIVFAANSAVNRCSGVPGWDGLHAGVRVFRDAADNWVGTRRVWNQHTYHITNIRENLRLPGAELPNWRRFNTFRTNAQSFDAPNLVAVAALSHGTVCAVSEDPMFLEATIENRGAVSVGAGLAVSFYLGTPAAPGRLVGTATTDASLLPGGSTTVSVLFIAQPEEYGVALDWFARADDTGGGVAEHNECDESDNEIGAAVECSLVE